MDLVMDKMNDDSGGDSEGGGVLVEDDVTAEEVGIADEVGIAEDEGENDEVVVEKEKRCECDDEARESCDHELFDCIYCPCNSFDKIKDNIQCPTCFIWYCAECVGLKGLTQDDMAKMVNWECYSCWSVSSPIAGKVITPVPQRCDEESVMPEEEPTRKEKKVREIVQQEIAKLIPAIKETVEKSVNETANVTINKETQKQIKAYADAAAKSQKTAFEKVVEEAAPKDTVVNKIVESSFQKLDCDLIERRKREYNVVIKNVEERLSPKGEVRKAEDLQFAVHVLKIAKDDIVKIYRVGTQKLPTNDDEEPYNRPLIIQLRSKELAEYYHNYGRGYKEEGYYINQDLCKSDREAFFRLREATRKQKADAEKAKTYQNAQQTAQRKDH